MKLVLGELVDGVDALKELAQCKDIEIGLSFKLSLFLDDVDAALKNYSKLHQQEVMEFGQKNEDGSYEVKPENVPAFLEKINALKEEEIEVEELTLKISDLTGAKLSPDSFRKLRWLIKKD